MDPTASTSLDADAVAQFRRLGATVGGGSLEPAANRIEVWEANGPSLSVFRRCGTQWRVVAGFGPALHLGLDYAGVEVVMRRALGLDADLDAVFADLQIMEAEALSILNGGGS